MEMEQTNKYPTVFVNHGGGPLPLLGNQPSLVNIMKKVVNTHLPALTNNTPPKAIVVISAHFEHDPISITSSPNPSMFYDYQGFPPQSYKFQYPAPGSPHLAKLIQELLDKNGLKSILDESRGFDHGVFVPLMMMYPKANIPVVTVSLHSSLDVDINLRLGRALEPLRYQQILILGSGYTFHNMNAIFNPTNKSIQASKDFNNWLKNTLLSNQHNSNHDDECSSEILDGANILDNLRNWKQAPGASLCHPREEHLLPLFVVAAAAGYNYRTMLIHDSASSDIEMKGHNAEHFIEHAVTGYIFN